MHHAVCGIARRRLRLAVPTKTEAIKPTDLSSASAEPDLCVPTSGRLLTGPQPLKFAARSSGGVPAVRKRNQRPSLPVIQAFPLSLAALIVGSLGRRDLAPKLYPVPSSPWQLDLPGWAVVATGAGAEPSAQRSARSRRGWQVKGEGELRRGLPSELRVSSCVVVIGPPGSERDAGVRDPPARQNCTTDFPDGQSVGLECTTLRGQVSRAKREACPIVSQ